MEIVALSSLIFIIIWGVFVINIIKATKHGKSSSISLYKQPKKEQASSLIQDNKNDWLSKQLEEERIAYIRISRIFDFDTAKEHSRNCDANGIDTGRARKKVFYNN